LDNQVKASVYPVPSTREHLNTYVIKNKNNNGKIEVRN